MEGKSQVNLPVLELLYYTAVVSATCYLQDHANLQKTKHWLMELSFGLPYPLENQTLLIYDCF